VTDLVVAEMHHFFKSWDYIPEGYENAVNPMQIFVYDLSMYITYVSFSIIVFLLINKKDLVVFLIVAANLIIRGIDLVDFILYKNQSYLDIKDYLITAAFIIAIVYGVRTYRRKKGNTEEIVNVTNIALLKMLIPNKELTTVNNLIEEKEKVNTEYNNLLYHLQHQIKQPFTSLEGLMQLEESEMRQQMIYKCLQDVKNYLHELTNLDYIANHYKLEARSLKFKNVLNEAKNRVPNIGKIHLHYYESNVEGFRMDELLLTSILEKLLQNAVNFSKESTFQKPNVYVYVYTNNPSELVIEVKDEGIGIEAEHQDRIFEMFYKGSLKSTGVGLGLYIVKKTIEKLNGKIYVDSKLNYGTSFKVLIPEIKEGKSQESKEQTAA